MKKPVATIAKPDAVEVSRMWTRDNSFIFSNDINKWMGRTRVRKPKTKKDKPWKAK